MRYNGGKAACAKELSEIINSYSPGNYWEPFVGAANIITRIRARRKLGTDKDASIIHMLNAVKNGWTAPESVTEADYRAAREVPETNPLHAFCKYGCSFGGKPWGGFARSGDRNYALNAKRSLDRIRPALKDIEFSVGGYEEVKATEFDFIYCDPPYRNTTVVGCGGRFDTDAFLVWCEQRVREGKVVLVSERELPAPWKCVWEKQLSDGLGKSKLKERLFRLSPLDIQN